VFCRRLQYLGLQLHGISGSVASHLLSRRHHLRTFDRLNPHTVLFAAFLRGTRFWPASGRAAMVAPRLPDITEDERDLLISFLIFLVGDRNQALCALRKEQLLCWSSSEKADARKGWKATAMIQPRYDPDDPQQPPPTIESLQNELYRTCEEIGVARGHLNARRPTLDRPCDRPGRCELTDPRC
jgi:hypothetical protein